MTAICERAGLTERYFYESFNDRDALLVALLDTIAVEVMDASVAALEAGGTGEERARAPIRALVEILTADPRKGRAALVASLSVPVLRARRQELLAGFAQLVTDRTRELYGERAWSAPDDQIESLLFVGGLAELLSAWLTGAVHGDRGRDRRRRDPALSRDRPQVSHPPFGRLVVVCPYPAPCLCHGAFEIHVRAVVAHACRGRAPPPAGTGSLFLPGPSSPWRSCASAS